VLESCVLTWGGRRARAAQVREHAANVQQTAWAVAAAIPMCAHRRGMRLHVLLRVCAHVERSLSNP